MLWRSVLNQRSAESANIAGSTQNFRTVRPYFEVDGGGFNDGLS